MSRASVATSMYLPMWTEVTLPAAFRNKVVGKPTKRPSQLAAWPLSSVQLG
jgi:hypothetical protein